MAHTVLPLMFSVLRFVVPRGVENSKGTCHVSGTVQYCASMPKWSHVRAINTITACCLSEHSKLREELIIAYELVMVLARVNRMRNDSLVNEDVVDAEPFMQSLLLMKSLKTNVAGADNPHLYVPALFRALEIVSDSAKWFKTTFNVEQHRCDDKIDEANTNGDQIQKNCLRLVEETDEKACLEDMIQRALTEVEKSFQCKSASCGRGLIAHTSGLPDILMLVYAPSTCVEQSLWLQELDIITDRASYQFRGSKTVSVPPELRCYEEAVDATNPNSELRQCVMTPSDSTNDKQVTKTLAIQAAMLFIVDDDCGHIVTLRKRGNGKTYLCSNSDVMQCSGNDELSILTSPPYMLLYAAQEASERCDADLLHKFFTKEQQLQNDLVKVEHDTAKIREDLRDEQKRNNSLEAQVRNLEEENCQCRVREKETRIRLLNERQRQLRLHIELEKQEKEDEEDEDFVSRCVWRIFRSLVFFYGARSRSATQCFVNSENVFSE